MFIIVDGRWRDSDEKAVPKEKPIATNINNGNTIFIRERPDITKVKFTIDLEVITANDTLTITIAKFNSIEEAMDYTYKMLDNYRQGENVYGLGTISHFLKTQHIDPHLLQPPY